MVTLRVATLGVGPDLEIRNAEWVALGFFWMNPSSRPGGIDEVAGQPPLNQITTSDLRAINRTFVARSASGSWKGILDAGELDWLRDLEIGWDLVEMDAALWATARPKLVEAMQKLDRRYIRRAVATKMLHLKRPRLVPVLDGLVVRQLQAEVPGTVGGTMVLIDHLREVGRTNQPALAEIRRFLKARELDRSLVRILDGLLWSTDPASGYSNLGRLVDEIGTHGVAGAAT